MEVSKSRSLELLWGLRGAGQFLGLVTELSIWTYPYSLWGNEQGEHMYGTYVFLPQQLDAVCTALRGIMENSTHISAGHLTIAQAPPDLKQQVLVVTPQIFCSADEAAKLLQPLVVIGPVQQTFVPSSFDRQCDHLNWICAKGDFKRASQTGLDGWNVKNIKTLVEIHGELVAECPDAARSGFTVKWLTPCMRERELKSSFGLENINYWL